MGPITFGIYRILGNDLPPRHGTDQTLLNTEFILRNEETFEDCQKFYVLNRIVDHNVKTAIMRRCTEASAVVLDIPFQMQEYVQCRTFEEKAAYLTNLNPARNYCIKHSRMNNHDICLPLDGRVFLRRDGWQGFEDLVYNNMPVNEGAYALPYTRGHTFEELLSPRFAPQTRERYAMGGGSFVTGMRELQLAFTQRCDVTFNEKLPYGIVDKVYTMWQLGMAGPWDRWHPNLREQAFKELSEFAGSVKFSGFCCRMPAHSDCDTDNAVRGNARNKGIKRMVATVDERMRSY